MRRLIRKILLVSFLICFISSFSIGQQQSNSSVNQKDIGEPVYKHQFEFKLQGCKFVAGGDMVCQFTIKNIGADSRRIVLTNDSRIVDDSGNEYRAVKTSLGGISQNYSSGSETSSVLIEGIINTGSIQFNQVNPGAKSIQVLRLVCRWEVTGGNNISFPADFKNVPLTNFTSTQIQAPVENLYDTLLTSISRGEQVTFPIKHRHPGVALGMDVDICAGKLILSKESLEFQGSQATLLGRNAGYHDFKVPLDKIYEITIAPEKFGRLFMKIGIVKKDGKEDKKEFNFYSSGAALKNTGIKSPYYEIECDRNCTDKTALIKRLIDHLKQTSNN